MLVCVYKSELQTLILNLNLRPFVRNYRTKRIITTDSSEFTNSFLKKQCGLSGKSLIRASKHVNFDSSNQRPHSVVNIFRIFGFPPSNITKIITCNPRILQCYPDKAIQPKLDFLLSILASQSDVVNTITRNPKILQRSLYNHLIPLVNQLKCLTGCYPSLVAFVKCNPTVLTRNNFKSSLLNIKFLVSLGVPNSQILKILTMYGHASTKPHDRFRDVVLKLMDMGFDLSSSYFLQALSTFTIIKDSTWKSKCVLLKSFGFSDQEILFMFKRQPFVMCFTEKPFIEKMEFFLNKLQWTTFRLSSNPILVISERKFVKKFVTAFKDEVPEVMEAYEGKLRFDEYTFKQKGQLHNSFMLPTIFRCGFFRIQDLFSRKQMWVIYLSGEDVVRACKCLDFDSSGVLEFFQTFGFSMSKLPIISAYPGILHRYPGILHRRFIENFVTAYKDEVPEVMEAYYLALVYLLLFYVR
ncbi:hypothetical protein POM88_043907 [Heracleum sosnowskyi]|uniref:Uncharacterized protein n=1 Tax=Heracleum sosnowskyi TaxID=360622 RepID=A0AAD8M4W6_9APIA|nr:hypothetical protein POM88_043907 [Heracleum sosnowskyi]